MLLLLFQVLFATVAGQLSVPWHTVCARNACYTAHMGSKPFHKALESCKANGGSLATVKDAGEAVQIQRLLSSLPMAPPPRGQWRFWMGLQLPLRHCYQQHRPLRGFRWTSGDEETEFSNWAREPQSTCTAHRCVHIASYPQGSLKGENFQWSDGVCSHGVDGYLCKFSFKGMCRKMDLSGPGSVTYTTPFNAESSSLSLVPFGSLATVSCEDGGISAATHYVLCVEQSPKLFGWSMDGPFCAPPSGCIIANGGCAQVCVSDGERGHHCQCENGYQLGADQRSCEPLDHCQGDPCEYRCVNFPVGFRCSCPAGYELAGNGRDCADTDECAGAPCAQLCINSAGGYRCACTEGFAMVAGQCQDRDECSARPCAHLCQNTDGSYRCHCRAGYVTSASGHSCMDVDECTGHPCAGICSNTEGSFACSCSEGYALGEDNASCVPESMVTTLLIATEPAVSDTTAGGWSPSSAPGPMVHTADWGSTPLHLDSPATPTQSETPTTGRLSGQSDGRVTDFSAGSWSPMPFLTVRQPPGTGGTPRQVEQEKGTWWLLLCALGSAAALLLVLCAMALILYRRHRSAKEQTNKAGHYYSWVQTTEPSSFRAPDKVTSVHCNPSADSYMEIEANQTAV
ncbi:complement component C1q receptor-like [Heterodontus francisci]|uniref:complement component C1q receptor-like n=1 Tax=Heterodontus francisci TaxID=7792 RepID=UPI00355AD57A